MSDYTTYLASPEWAARRDAALERAERRCQICNADRRLEVHHRTYERLGDERPGDLTVLCARCHSLFHAHVGGARAAARYAAVRHRQDAIEAARELAREGHA